MRGSRCLQPCRSSCPGFNNSSASFWLMPQSFQFSFRNRSWRSSMLLYRCVCVCACVSFFSDQMFSYAKKPETETLKCLMSKHVVGVVDTCSSKLMFPSVVLSWGYRMWLWPDWMLRGWEGLQSCTFLFLITHFSVCSKLHYTGTNSSSCCLFRLTVVIRLCDLCIKERLRDAVRK